MKAVNAAGSKFLTLTANPILRPLFVIAIAILLVPCCAPPITDITPDKHKFYHSLTLNINVKNTQSNKSQSFKAILKYNEQRDKMLFLSPLNQVYGQLVIDNETALLANTRNNRFWTGDFRTLIGEIWGLDFSYLEFKQLITEGKIPEKKITPTLHGSTEELPPPQAEPEIQIEREKEAPAPYRIVIRYERMMVRLKISDRQTSRGVVDFSAPMDKLQKSYLRDVLEGDK